MIELLKQHNQLPEVSTNSGIDTSFWVINTLIFSQEKPIFVPVLLHLLEDAIRNILEESELEQNDADEKIKQYVDSYVEAFADEELVSKLHFYIHFFQKKKKGFIGLGKLIPLPKASSHEKSIRVVHYQAEPVVITNLSDEAGKALYGDVLVLSGEKEAEEAQRAKVEAELVTVLHSIFQPASMNEKAKEDEIAYFVRTLMLKEIDVIRGYLNYFNYRLQEKRLYIDLPSLVKVEVGQQKVIADITHLELDATLRPNIDNTESTTPITVAAS